MWFLASARGFLSTDVVKTNQPLVLKRHPLRLSKHSSKAKKDSEPPNGNSSRCVRRGHILSLSLSLSRARALAHTYSLFLSLALSRSLSLSLSLFLAHTLSLFLPFSHSHSLSGRRMRLPVLLLFITVGRMVTMGIRGSRRGLFIQLILHEQTRTCQAHTYMHMPYLTQNTHSRALTHTAHDTRTEIHLCATGVSARVVSQGKQALTSLVKYLRMVAAPA